MESNTTGTSCLGPLAGLQAQQELYRETVKALGDPQVTTLILVTYPESSAFREAARTSIELQQLGVKNQHLIINRVFESDTTSDPVAMAMQSQGQSAIQSMPAELSSLARTLVPMTANGLMGIDALRIVGTPRPITQTDANPAVGTRLPACGEDPRRGLPAGLDAIMDELASAGHGVILTMGKGGVGKTTVASAVAVALAERGLEVYLSTTDPAAHISATLAAESLAGLTVGRIDPAEETAAYTAEVMQTAGSELDAGGKALLEEDLRSPCTEEIAVFRALAKAVAEGTRRFVVLDTAPTGHTILLLDAALAYHREVTRQTHQMPESVEQLLPRLRDPDFTRVLIVTLPAATPVHEAAQLQRDLQRAEIEPFAWVINESLATLDVQDPLLRQRQQHEIPFINEVRDKLAGKVALIPWQLETPTGIDGLRRIMTSNRSVSQP